MPSPTHNPFVSKIFPVTPFNSKISTLVPRYPSDSKRSEGGGGALHIKPFLHNNSHACTKTRLLDYSSSMP